LSLADDGQFTAEPVAGSKTLSPRAITELGGLATSANTCSKLLRGKNFGKLELQIAEHCMAPRRPRQVGFLDFESVDCLRL